ncbi:MAG: Nif3-like dinuclear metal center hexameric protein [Limnochordia bacterium]|jgi:dinuclear metal center YbgI/SA1388 family protein
MAVKVMDIANLIEEVAPLALAEEWDNVGLQLGHPDLTVEGIVVALDFTAAVLTEGLEKGANLFVVHHPLFYRPVKQIRTDEPFGALIAHALQRGVAVYAAHTNLDNAPDGLNSWLAQTLELEPTDSFGKDMPLEKLVVFVPKDHVGSVLDALAAAGAGHIGQYSHCTFQAPGKGTFRPLAGANPYLGHVGQLEEVDEIRLETVYPAIKAREVVEALLAAHPYEEVAYDRYRLANPELAAGPGRLAQLKEPTTLAALAKHVQEKLEADHVRLVGPPEKTVQKVALCGGSGSSFIPTACALGADVLITGDVKYHDALDAQARGLGVIDGGHYWTEQVVTKGLQGIIKDRFPQLRLWLAQSQGSPFAVID